MNKIISTIFAMLILTEISQAKNILIIGDSHSCGSFGSMLVSELSVQNNKVDIFCAVSSSPSNWVMGTTPAGQVCKSWGSDSSPTGCRGDGKIPPLDWILSQKHYDSALIALGTNSLGSPKADSTYKKLADKIKEKIGSCVWIGPPHLRPDQAKGFSSQRLLQMEQNSSAFYTSLDSAVGPSCTLINSQTVTDQPTPAGETVDGVHRSQSSGTAWAKSLINLGFNSPAKTGDVSRGTAPLQKAAK